MFLCHSEIFKHFKVIKEDNLDNTNDTNILFDQTKTHSMKIKLSQPCSYTEIHNETHNILNKTGQI